MAYLIKWRPVQKEQILIIVATMHVQSGEHFCAGSHSRKALKRLYHIRRTKQGVFCLQIMGIEGYFACLGSVYR